MSDFDVAIVGGGPAGTAAALTLLRYSHWRPVVVERSCYDGWRAGETLSPGVAPLLGWLGAESVLTGQQQRRAYATSAAWGSADVVSRDFLFTGGGDAWHLDRTRFDASLAQLVADRGGTLLTNTTWPAGLQARFVIDASGRHAVYARTQGARATIDDHLTGLVSIFEEGDESGTATLVEAVDDGWWYSARLPANRTVVAFMTDADVVRAAHLHEPSVWLARLAAAPRTHARIAQATLAQEPVVCPAHSQILDRVDGDGWIACGEAAASFDPLSSMGIGYAVASGIQAARIAAATLAGDAHAAALYAADVRRHYDAYLLKRRAYYMMEQRWPESAFWKRRWRLTDNRHPANDS
jgi:flavin-dependent dehydrogenase